MNTVGFNVNRKDAHEKVTGTARYNADYIIPGALSAKMLTSTFAHAKILSIDTSEAWKTNGVRAIVTGDNYPVLTGEIIEDRPILAKDKVRYYGEPVVLVVADKEYQAVEALNKIKIDYQPLPVVNCISDSIKENPAIIHENLMEYRIVKPINPVSSSNIAAHVKVRKGEIQKAWSECDEIVESNFTLPQTDHVAMETRNCKVEIKPDGKIIIETSSQAPFKVREEVSKYFGIDIGKVVVKTPYVGGGFGGKAAVFQELLGVIASKSVGGRKIKLANTREEDFATAPVKIGLEAKIKIGCSKEGKIKAGEFVFWVDSGAYADLVPRICKAIAANCTGPYNIENIRCDCYCIYTNHPYGTAFRGFGHEGYTFAIERTIDMLAKKVGIDPLEFRIINALKPGDKSPTQKEITLSNFGNLKECISRMKTLADWEEGQRIDIGKNKIRAKGLACFWKTPTSPTDAVSNVVLIYNPDGSINLMCGAVEIGPGMKTTAAQILAEKLKMNIDKIHVHMDVSTEVDPEHWKTVASLTTYMVGRAVLEAAEDLKSQVLSMASIVLRCPPEDLDMAGDRVFIKDEPQSFIDITEVIHGYRYPNGNAIGGQIIGKGSFILRLLTDMDPETGKGDVGPSWTVGIQGVEIEIDMTEYSYRFLKAFTVLDAGKVLHPKIAKGVVMGGMSMGLGLGSREELVFSQDGVVQDIQLRDYKVLRYGENPEYYVDFIETPQLDAPYGARGFAEHGIIGIPAALANALSTAVNLELNHLPIYPEKIWKTAREGNNNDPI